MRNLTLVPRTVYQDPRLVGLSPLARDLWLALWQAVSDAGTIPQGGAYLLRALPPEQAELFTGLEAQRAAQELVDRHLLVPFEAAGVAYLWHPDYHQANAETWKGREDHPLPPWLTVQEDRKRYKYVRQDVRQPEGDPRPPDPGGGDEPTRPLGAPQRVPPPFCPTVAPAVAPSEAAPMAQTAPIAMETTVPATVPAPLPATVPPTVAALMPMPMPMPKSAFGAHAQEQETVSRARAVGHEAERLSPQAGAGPPGPAAYLDAVQAAIGRRLFPAGWSQLVYQGVTPELAAELARRIERRAPGRARNLAYLVGANLGQLTDRAPPRHTAQERVLTRDEAPMLLGGILSKLAGEGG